MSNNPLNILAVLIDLNTVSVIRKGLERVRPPPLQIHSGDCSAWPRKKTGRENYDPTGSTKETLKVLDGFSSGNRVLSFEFLVVCEPGRKILYRLRDPAAGLKVPLMHYFQPKFSL